MRETGVPEYLSTWIQGQRWFAGKSRAPRWERIGGFDLVSADAAARVTVHLLLDRADPPILYQVPLTSRVTPLDGQELALVGTQSGRFVYDGTRDPAGAEAILRLILDEGTARPDGGDPGLAARGHSAPGTPAMEVVGSRILSGEQSNSSIIFDVVGLDGGPQSPVICKVFRSLHHGENPDVTLTGAVSGAGSTVVPRSVGHIIGQWRDSGEPTGFAHGHLAFAQEFLPGVDDAWRVALAAAIAGEDFSDAARTLGEATADVHLTLAAALPSHPATAEDTAAVIASMRRRFAAAVGVVPSLAEFADDLDAVHSRIAGSAWPALQRVHGDYHLGQVLLVPDRGWVALDFEGEPLRPMTERAADDSPLRDVAGMLRSFDYVAGSVQRSHPDAAESVTAWAAAARAAFLVGYQSRSGLDLRANRALLDAFEIDKALYEAVYEARNRPGWLEIPTAAIGRLVRAAA